MEEKSYHPRIKQFYENYLSGHEPRRSDLAESKHGRRATRLKAVARELRKIGYIVIENSSGSGLVVIAREEKGSPMMGTDPPG